MPTILQFTDTHLTIDPQGTLKGVVTRDSLRSCVAMAQQHTASQILLTGDLSHDASQESYQALRDIITPLNIPVSAIAGNHDIESEMKKSLPATWTTGECSRGSWQIILLNSAVTGEEYGYITKEELQRAETIISNTTNPNIMICLHHQPVPVGSSWIDSIMLQNPEPLFELIDAHDTIRGLLFGHVHQNYQSQRKQLTIIGSPSTCIQFQSNSQQFGLDNIAPGFRLIHLHDNGDIDSEIFYLDKVPSLNADEAY